MLKHSLTSVPIPHKDIDTDGFIRMMEIPIEKSCMTEIGLSSWGELTVRCPDIILDTWLSFRCFSSLPENHIKADSSCNQNQSKIIDCIDSQLAYQRTQSSPYFTLTFFLIANRQRNRQNKALNHNYGTTRKQRKNAFNDVELHPAVKQ